MFFFFERFRFLSQQAVPIQDSPLLQAFFSERVAAEENLRILLRIFQVFFSELVAAEENLRILLRIFLTIFFDDVKALFSKSIFKIYFPFCIFPLRF